MLTNDQIHAGKPAYRFLFLLLFSLCAPWAAAETAGIPPNAIAPPSDAAGVFRIWPGVAPGSEEWTHSESVVEWGPLKHNFVHNVVEPTLTMFQPEPANATGTAVIIAPGGGMMFLSMDNEGYLVARWLASRGITAFVLKYRTMRSPDDKAGLAADTDKLMKNLFQDPDPNVRANAQARMLAHSTLAIEDGKQAVRHVRAHATELRIEPSQIVTIGFSAGGAVVLGGALQPDAESRANYVASIYGATFLVGLTGEPAHVPDNPPRLFMAVSGDDVLVGAWQIPLYLSLKQAGVATEIHIYEGGGHGYGMNKQGGTSDHWVEDFYWWMDAHGLTVPKDGAGASGAGASQSD